SHANHTTGPSTPASRSPHWRWAVKKASSSVSRVIAGERSPSCRRPRGLTLPLGTGSTILAMYEDGLLIGDVAEQSAASRKALRLYEAASILARPRRTASGYRIYDTDALAVVDFVRQA